MSDSYVQVPADSTGKKIDSSTLNVGADTVLRQRITIGDNSATAQFATVTNGALLVIGAMSIGAGTANIGFINNISATVVVAGTVSLGVGTALIGAVSLGAGTANIGFINNISATVTVAVANPYVVAIMSASHGPLNAIASTSANVTLVGSPGAGKAIFITMIGVSNEAGTATRARIGTSASINTVAMFMAATGGGFVMQFDPPWQLSASEAALCSIKPNAVEARFNVQFYVGNPV